MIVEGLIVRQRLNAGSKSEHVGFVLVPDDDENVTVRMGGDNLFEHNMLKPYEGTRVRITGDYFRGMFVGDNIEPV